MQMDFKIRQAATGSRSVLLAFTLLGLSSGTSLASDAAAELADRFAGPPVTQPAKADAPTTIENSRSRSTDDPSSRANTVLETLRQRIEASERAELTTSPEQDLATRPPTKITPKAPAALDTPPIKPPAEVLRGNDVFGDPSRSGQRPPTARSVKTWARPSMQRQGQSYEAAPLRPPGPIERVTILLVMKTGDRGIRRFNKTADPIVCIADSCFVSRGPLDAARVMKRRKAFGTVNTLGKRAGACKNRNACVFRDIRIDGGRAEMQPIDLRFIRHDRRERTTIEADRTCGVFRGRLTCGKPIESETYTAWVVPEDVAVEAGVRAVEAALRTRLAGPRSPALR